MSAVVCCPFVEMLNDCQRQTAADYTDRVLQKRATHDPWISNRSATYTTALACVVVGEYIDQVPDFSVWKGLNHEERPQLRNRQGESIRVNGVRVSCPLDSSKAGTYRLVVQDGKAIFDYHILVLLDQQYTEARIVGFATKAMLLANEGNSEGLWQHLGPSPRVTLRQSELLPFIEFSL